MIAEPAPPPCTITSRISAVVGPTKFTIGNSLTHFPDLLGSDTGLPKAAARHNQPVNPIARRFELIRTRPECPGMQNRLRFIVADRRDPLPALLARKGAQLLSP